MSAAAIQRRHQLRTETLAQGITVDELTQLCDESLVAAEREIGVDPILQRLESELFEAVDVGSRERLVCEVVERTAAPERERSAKPLHRRVRIAVRQQAPTLSREPLEALGVELIGADLQDVSRRS